MGELGDGTTANSNVPRQVVGLPTGISAVAAGCHHTCALAPSVSAFCWGRNSSGQLGDGTTTGRTIAGSVDKLESTAAISAGREHTCALTAAGKVHCWGGNDLGQLGDGTFVETHTPTPISRER